MESFGMPEQQALWAGGVADGSGTITLRLVGPYSARLSLHLLGLSDVQTADYVPADCSHYRRVIRVDERLHLVEACFGGSTDAPVIKLRQIVPEGPLAGRQVEDLGRMLGANLDLREFYSALSAESRTHSLGGLLYGLKPLRSLDLYEAVVIAITEQQVSYSAAARTRQRLSRSFGDCVTLNCVEYREFPRACRVSAASIRELREVGLSETRARCLRSVAELEASSPGGLGGLFFGKTSGQIVDELLKLRGIGPWSAAYAVARGLGAYNHVPVGDLALDRGAEMAIGGGTPVGPLLESFREYAGLAAFYLIYYYAFSRLPNWPPADATWTT